MMMKAKSVPKILHHCYSLVYNASLLYVYASVCECFTIHVNNFNFVDHPFCGFAISQKLRQSLLLSGRFPHISSISEKLYTTYEYKQ